MLLVLVALWALVTGFLVGRRPPVQVGEAVTQAMA
jgi:hypothetical protein